jgi:hypothetical protein
MTSKLVCGVSAAQTGYGLMASWLISRRHKTQAVKASPNLSPISGYHVQAAHYLNGLEAEKFIFIAVEKSYPFAVAVYELDASALLEGGSLAFRDLRRIATCRGLDEWPGYSQEITTLSLPMWAYNDDITPEDF